MCADCLAPFWRLHDNGQGEREGRRGRKFALRHCQTPAATDAEAEVSATASLLRNRLLRRAVEQVHAVHLERQLEGLIGLRRGARIDASDE